MSLYVKLESVKAGNRNSLLSALSSLSDFDSDFNGENGIDYLWEEVWEANGFESLEDFESKYEEDEYEEDELKYESNLHWLLDEVKEIEDDADCIETFFRIWMENDSNYYEEYEVNYIRNKNGKVTAVSFAATHND